MVQPKECHKLEMEISFKGTIAYYIETIEFQLIRQALVPKST